MKHSILITAAACMLFAAGCESTRSTTTSTTDGAQVTTVTAPNGVQTSFMSRYPTATNVRWSRYNSTTTPIDYELTDWQVLSPKDYTVSYTMDGNNYNGWYNANGEWIGSSYAITDYNGLPAAVNSTITSKFPGSTISGVQNTYWKDRNAYQIELRNGNEKTKLFVDMNGNILKQKTKMK